MNSPSRTSLGFLLTGLLGVLVGALVVACTTGHFLNSNAAGQASNVASASPLRGASGDLQQRIIDTVKRTEPSVVLIQSTVHGQQIMSPFGNDPFFRQFFGDQGPGDVARPFTAKASGSGFIIKREGNSATVATNAHVIYHADKISVLLSNGRRVDASVIGSDIRTDLALLKITGNNLPPALPIGNSNALQQGQFVLAIGEPEQFQNSVSFGIVSALHRTSIVAGGEQNIPSIHYPDMIQTTTPINPGNSGGPLLTDTGEVVGLAAVVAPQAQALGFAIPINSAQPILAELERHGAIVHPYMGVVMQPLTKQISTYLGYGNKSGVVVNSVVPDSPAARAGLQQGDVIVEVDRKKVSDPDQVRTTISHMHVGDKLTLLIWRNGNLQPYDVTLQNEPETLGQG